MDKVTREIFRAWNWPTAENKSFSTRPTPYNISKLNYLNPASVYKHWNHLFNDKFIRNIYLVPTEYIGYRQTVLIMDVKDDLIDSVLAKLDDAYFVEMIHTGHLYKAHGTYKRFLDGEPIVSLDLLADSPDLAIKQSNILFTKNGQKPKTLILHEERVDHAAISEKQKEIMNMISYKGLYDLDLNDLGHKLNVSKKTIQRRIDSLLAQNFLSAYPITNQNKISDFNLFMIFAEIPQTQNFSQIKNKLINLKQFGSRYLVFRSGVRFFGALLYSETPGEIDSISEELKAVIPNHAVLTRYVTYLNENARISLH